MRTNIRILNKQTHLDEPKARVRRRWGVSGCRWSGRYVDMGPKCSGGSLAVGRTGQSQPGCGHRPVATPTNTIWYQLSVRGSGLLFECVVVVEWLRLYKPISLHLTDTSAVACYGGVPGGHLCCCCGSEWPWCVLISAQG